jgi:hypothetical protein
MKKKRMLLAAAAATVGFVAFAGPAQAAPPQAAQGSIDLAADTADTDGYCAFPVHIDYLSNQRVKETTGPNGETVQHFTGWALAIVTNTDTGKTLKFKVSGPGTVTTFPDEVEGSDAFTLDVAGANLLWTTVDNSYPGVPQLAYTTGHVQVEVAAGGNTTSYELNGNGGEPIDVCALLA